MTPTERLIPAAMGQEIDMVRVEDIPFEIQNYLKSGILPPSCIKPNPSISSKLIAKILMFKRNKIFDEGEQLLFDLNLMDFGEDIIGVDAASNYYFKKPATNLQIREWKSLIGFYRMFSN